MQHKIIPSAIPLPSAPATDSQRQALRELASKVHPIHRSNVVAGLDTLTFEQATQRVGYYYLLAGRQLGYYTRTYVVPDNSAGPSLPQGSLVLLRLVDASSLHRGDIALYTNKQERSSILGRIDRVLEGQYPRSMRLTLAQTEANYTLWAHQPNVRWYRVEVISLAY